MLLICWENGAYFGKAGEVEEAGGDTSVGLVSPGLSQCCEQPHVTGQSGSGSGMCLGELEQTGIWYTNTFLTLIPPLGLKEEDRALIRRPEGRL